MPGSSTPCHWTTLHYSAIAKQREREKLCCSQGWVGSPLKKCHHYITRSADRTKVMSKFIRGRATWPRRKHSGIAQKPSLSFRCISEYELISRRLSENTWILYWQFSMWKPCHHSWESDSEMKMRKRQRTATISNTPFNTNPSSQSASKFCF